MTVKKLKENGKFKRLDKYPYAIYHNRIGYIKKECTMDRKNKGFLKTLRDVYKKLPLKMRVRVNMTASELLELQKGNNAFAGDAGEKSLDEERGK
jgi:hypothetical protein